ncbi:hypothetical protein STA1M1_13860 [Sinisalibacter aestuarii]|uniref:Uncharacterized protein n=2 Tax=Sinisalibacter aestuarii TaxID=2949426 RepID=A0ABQ5LTS7_9RHOB|nr:hypothetical protein STA1M1_13860 [Sinisalibacter aestuarii]
MAIMLALPGWADEAQPCWHYGAAPGLFDWNQSPSTACRDGASPAPAIPVPPAAPRPGPVAGSGDSAPAAPDTSFTFSGQAYIGVGALF